MSSADAPPAPPGLSLVLGAGGFLGTHLARWLARAGARARLFDLSVDSIPADVRSAPTIEVVQGNFLDGEDLRRALAGVERVFHLVGATVPSTSVDRLDIELEANVQPAVRLLEAMHAAGTPLVVFPSSGGTVYGDASTGTAFVETSPPRPSCSYGLGKLLVEQLLEFQARAGGPHFLVLRIANVYGPTVHDHRRQGVVNAFLQRLQSGRPLRVWGDGAAVRDYLYVDDLVAAVAALLAAGIRDDTLNVGSGEGHSISELIEIVARVTGREVRIERVADAYPGVSRNVLDISRIAARAGWRPAVDLPTGIGRTWAAMVGGESPR